MIDFQGLLTVLRLGEENPNMAMHSWDCGTTQCLIGTFCVHNPEDKLRLVNKNDYRRPAHIEFPRICVSKAIAVRFGITSMEAEWLFIKNPLNYECYTHSSAISLSKKQALARLRKFIYYKLHKQEMIVEAGRNKQQIHLGRNISGRSSVILAAQS